MSSMHTFEKCQCDGCQHRSVVKNTPPPSPSFPVPIPPPHPSANCPGPMVSGLLDHVTLSANGSGAPGTQHRQAYCRKKFLTVFTFLLTYLLFIYQQASAAGNQYSVENQIEENSIL
jgi:hypothetical protein